MPGAGEGRDRSGAGSLDGAIVGVDGEIILLLEDRKALMKGKRGRRFEPRERCRKWQLRARHFRVSASGLER
jgi:hypothetical protein